MFSKTQKPPLGQQINWSHPLSKGLVGCWLMNEGSGDRIYDVSGNNNDGVLVGTVKPVWVPGKSGSCLQFDGSRRTVTVLDSPSLNLPNAFTITAMVNQTGLVNWTRIVTKGDTNYMLLMWTSGRPYLAMKVGSVEYNTHSATETVLPNGQWHLLIGTFDGTTMRYYYDGKREGLEKAIVGLADTNTSVVSFGSPGINYYYGCMSDIRIYNRALSAQEIWQLYQSPYAMFEGRPVWMDYVQAASGLSIPVAMHHYKMMRGN
jgi:hypothetical protein